MVGYSQPAWGYEETFEAFKTGINDGLNNSDKKYKPQILSLMTRRVHAFEKSQIMAG
jgi:hypothetical protein